MSKYALVDCCPVPARLEPVIREVKRRSGQVLVSCYRGADAAALLHRCGKSSQSELYWGWRNIGYPRYNPANPPGYSTHELHNDGAAYNVPRGAKLPDYQVGQDWTNSYRVVAAYRAMGVVASLTYPNDTRERHHINIRQTPRGMGKLVKSSWRKGDKGKKVTGIQKMLHACVSPSSKKRYMGEATGYYGKVTTAAVKHFQRDHGLQADGVVGPHTRHQLHVTYDYWVKRRAKK